MTRGWFLLVWVNCPPIFKGMLGLTLFHLTHELWSLDEVIEKF